MTCFTHRGQAAVGICSVCQKAVCRDCVGRDTPRLVCRTCAASSSLAGYGWPWYYGGGYGFPYEYKSSMTIGPWPLVHVCGGIDPVTMRPRIAKGVVAIGNVAVGVLAIGGLSCGVLSFGGCAFGLLLTIGGAAFGLGLSVGGFAVGTIAIGGAAVGVLRAVGGAAFVPPTLR